jgi:hypothetical protein
VALEIQGDDRNGYNLVLIPVGFFTADYWYRTKQDALEAAEELFAIGPDMWSKAARIDCHSK